MLLWEARRELSYAVARVAQTTFSDFQLDAALREAVNVFSRVTDWSTSTTSVSLSSGASTVDVTATSGLTYFEANDFKNAYISNRRVAQAPLATVLRRHAAGLASGVPTMIAFRNRNDALLDKATDQAYTLKLTHTNLADFVPGSQGTYDGSTAYALNDAVLSSSVVYRALDANTGNAPASNPTHWKALGAASAAGTVVAPTTYDLPMPREWQDSIVRQGGKAYLLYGLGWDHPEADPSWRDWQMFLAEAAQNFGRPYIGVVDPTLPLHNQQKELEALGNRTRRSR